MGKCRNDASMRLAMHELRVMRQLRHPAIAMFYGACIDSATRSMIFVIEVIDGTDLGTYVRRKSLRTATKACEILTHISCALLYCHSCSPVVIHSDVKPANIMVHNCGGCLSLKLIDFGFAQLATSSHKPTLGGTWAYRAPETYRSPLMAAHPAIDVFAVGRLCHFVFVGTPPFAALGMTTEALKLRITGGEHLRPVWPSQVSPTGVRLRRLEELC